MRNLVNPFQKWAVSRTLLFSLVFLAASLALVRADGSETLGPPSVPIAQGTGIVGAGVGVFGGFGVLVPGDIDFTVPAGATVEQVLLYWAGSHLATSLPNDSTTIKVNEFDVTGSKIGDPTLVLDHYYITYRKDITDMGLVGAGPNTLSISGDPFVDRENDGVGVLVIYDDGTGASTIGVRDGNDFAYDRVDFSDPINVTVPQAFDFSPSITDRTANLTLLVGDVSAPDVERRANAIEVTVDGPGISPVTTSILDPVDPFWPLKSGDGALWDTVIASVDIPAGANSLTVEVISLGSMAGSADKGASLLWVAAALSVPGHLDGRFTGGGNVFLDDGTKVTRGLELHCDGRRPNNLQVNFHGSGGNFHLDNQQPLIFSECFDFDDVKINSDPPPETPIDTFIGKGTGTWNQVPNAVACFVLVDDGEPGTTDMMAVQVFAPETDPGDCSFINLGMPLNEIDPDGDGLFELLVEGAPNQVAYTSGVVDRGNLQAHKDNN